jgi:hypothetical protein
VIVGFFRLYSRDFDVITITLRLKKDCDIIVDSVIPVRVKVMTRQIGSPRSVIADSVIPRFFGLYSRDFDVITITLRLKKDCDIIVDSVIPVRVKVMTRQIGSPRSVIADSVIAGFFGLYSRDFDVITLTLMRCHEPYDRLPIDPPHIITSKYYIILSIILLVLFKVFIIQTTIK